MISSKLLLYNFSAPHVYETFFHNVPVGKTSCFYICPHFYEKLISGSIPHESIIYEQKTEVCCCCLTCRRKIISETNLRDELDEYFDDLKKLLIQYYYTFDGSAFLEHVS